MKISIALATYNGAEHLEEQLLSLAVQTFLPHELVVTDDGSTDDTLEILHHFAASSPFPVRIYINPQRLGYADNFLRAASLCEGEWIAFCDQDDVWLSDKLQEISFIANAGTTLITHLVQPVDAILRPVKMHSVGTRVKAGSGPFRLATFGYFSGLSIAFRRDLMNFMSYRPRFPDRNNMDAEAAHDQWICALADALGSTRKIKRQLVLYRQHNYNTCGARIKESNKLYSLTEHDSNKRYAQLALAFANCFAGMAASIPVDTRLKKAAYSASSHYRRAHQYFTLREHLYRNISTIGRLADWAKLTAQWLYRFNPGALPALACLKDLAAIVMLPKVVATPQRSQEP